VSAALLGTSGTLAASRAATITTWRLELPARRPITFTSSCPACVKRCTSGRPPRPPANPRAAKVSATSAAVSRLPCVPGRRSGDSAAIRVASSDA
jgi:hypothetical protein